MSTYTEAVRLQDHISRLEQELARSTERIRALRQQRAQVAARLNALQQQGASPDGVQLLQGEYDALIQQFVAAVSAQEQTAHELLVSKDNLQQIGY
jgi:septal ring factor EnvC (AmiA/AmiB activator)